MEIIGNAGWLFADKVLRLVVGLIVSIWVTRYLGPEQFGLLSYTGSFVYIFTSLAVMGLDWVVVRNIVRDPSRADEILGTTFLIKLAGGVAGFSLVLMAITIIRPDDWVTQMLVGITALGLFFQAFNAIDLWFQSQVKSRYTVYAKSAAFGLVSIIKILLILGEAPLEAFAWAGLAEIVIGSVGLLATYRINRRKIRDWRPTWAMAKELLRDSWPLILTDIVMLAYMRIDQVMIGQMVGNTEVGIYSVAVLLAETCYFIPMMVTSSLYPSIVEAKGESDELFYERLQKFYRLMTFLGYAVAVPMTFLASWAVTLLYGAPYAKAGPMLAVLAWGGVFMNLQVARSSFLIVMNWTRLHFATDLLGCLLNVGLNFYLIPRYGGMGAAIASVIAYWFVAHGSCFLFKPLRKTGTMINKALLNPKIW